MITDRTAQDVARWKELRDKGWAAMTAAERDEWGEEMRGRYSYTDMNRVESAVAGLSELFVSVGWLPSPLSVKTNWSFRDVPTVTDMGRYLGNIKALRDAAPVVYSDTPIAPGISDRFDYEKANDLEKILIDLEQIFYEQTQSGYYAGELYAGEV